MKFFLLLFFIACSHQPIKLTDSLKEELVSDHTPQKNKLRADRVHPTLKSQWMGKYWQIQDAADLLQDTQAATVSIRFKVDSLSPGAQDMIGIAVGSPKIVSSSRFSIRLENGQFRAILRAGDLDLAQELLTTGAAIRLNHWHTVTLVANYSKNAASIYLDGHKLEAIGTLKFSQPKTAATPSVCMSIGAEDDGGNAYFLGEISQLLIWRRELSSQEVYQL